jgi:hypothetical protein
LRILYHHHDSKYILCQSLSETNTAGLKLQFTQPLAIDDQVVTAITASPSSPHPFTFQ